MEHVRRMIADAEGLTDADWRRMAELGWHGLVIPEEHGGSGLGMLELAIVLDEMGRAVLPGPFIPTVLAGLAIRDAGDAAQRARWLPRIASGDVRVTLALLEESGRWDPAAIRATLARDGAGFV